MITLKQFMEVVGYRITEGSEFCWQCYGAHAHSLDSWNGLHDEGGHSLTIVFDTASQDVYEVAVHDYTNNRAYRLINPAFVASFNAEAKTRGIPFNEAWDEVNYCDVETEEDFMEKARAIVAGEDYDTTVEVPLNMDKDDLYQLMTMAHERNITFNQLVNEVLEAAVTEAEQEEKIQSVVDEARDRGNRIFTEDEWEAIREAKKSKQWVVEIVADENGELVLPFPDELVAMQNWWPGDTLEWHDNKDGTWSITKAE